MVSPVYLIAAALGAAFLLPLFDKIGKGVSRGCVVLIAAIFAFLPAYWYITGDLSSAPLIAQTAGFSAPFSINLMVGKAEALFMMAMNTAALLGTLYFITRKEVLWNLKARVLFLTFLLGANGLVMTRDIFNIFVFLEISSISMYALIAMIRSRDSYEAGFKYMIAGGVASALFLIGVIFIYRLTGSLNIDTILEDPSALHSGRGLIALFLMTVALLVELKPFPANGWGADAYEASEPGISALASAVSATSIFFVLYKLLPVLPDSLLRLLVFSGGTTFFLAQLTALKQKRVRRLLGYSSIGQIGLLIFTSGLLSLSGGTSTLLLIVLILVINHLFSKSGLFWISGILKNTNLNNNPGLRKYPMAMAVPGILVAALAGLPPFPAFWAKWMLVLNLVQTGSFPAMALLLGGSLLEAFYLFRWFLGVVKHEEDPGNVHEEIIPEDKISLDGTSAEATRLKYTKTVREIHPEKAKKLKTEVSLISPALGALILTVFGLILSWSFLADGPKGPAGSLFMLIPLGGILLFSLFDLLKLPVKFQAPAGIAVLTLYGRLLYPMVDSLRLIFALIFIGGAGIQLFAVMLRRGRHPGLISLLMGMVLSLGNLLTFTSAAGFFFSWELMTLTSFLLIARGKKSSGAALRYIVFSLAGAFLILAGLALTTGGTGGTFADIIPGSGAPVIASALFGLGFLIKLGALGLHIWLPGAYAEAEDEISSFLSSVLSKAGLFMLFITAGFYSGVYIPGLAAVDFAWILGWVGALTALMGTFMAVFQEDIKYTLAYSSMGQIGYMVLSFALMSQLGWVNSIYLASTHLLFKGMLFLAIAGIVHRTGTRMMYQMGGLIQRMPVSFISVLMAIIALSGVPPLTGFGAKWMLYTALIEKGWNLQAGVAMFTSGVAFLYLFRLIHVIFLGQLKDEHRQIKEAPVWVLIPQVLFMMVIMAFSMYPNLIIKPIQAAVAGYFPAGIEWEGYTVISSLGYWNGNAVMFVTMGIFMILLVWLVIIQSNPRKVKQFNIVYAAERPLKPETTHFGYNFFAHYRKALGFMLKPSAQTFWNGAASLVEAASSSVRRMYTGNGQTYAVQILLYVAILIIILKGGM